MKGFVESHYGASSFAHAHARGSIGHDLNRLGEEKKEDEDENPACWYGVDEEQGYSTGGAKRAGKGLSHVDDTTSGGGGRRFSFGIFRGGGKDGKKDKGRSAKESTSACWYGGDYDGESASSLSIARRDSSRPTSPVADQAQPTTSENCDGDAVETQESAAITIESLEAKHRRLHRRRASHPPPALTHSDVKKVLSIFELPKEREEAAFQMRKMDASEPEYDVPLDSEKRAFKGRRRSSCNSIKNAPSIVRMEGVLNDEEELFRDGYAAKGRRRSSRISIRRAPSIVSVGNISANGEGVFCDDAAPAPSRAFGSKTRAFSIQRRKRTPWTFSTKKKGGLNERSQKEYTFVFGAGICLSFNAGYINGACLSGLLLPNGMKQSVAGFTGAYTNSALNLAGGQYNDFGFQFTMILSFVFGSFLTGAINPEGKPYRLGPQYGPTFLIGALCLIIASILSETHPESRALFYFAAAANGLQNGMSSMYSGNLIRSTHYTGISTDIGLIIGQCFRGNRTSLWKLWVLLGLTSSFWMGSLVSFWATSAFRTHSLLFNAVFFFLIGIGLIVFLVTVHHISVWQAAFGTWQWEQAFDTLSKHHMAVGRKSIAKDIPDKNDAETSEEFLFRLFDKIDADGNGYIEENELFEALANAGMVVSKKSIRAMMKYADDNDDGLISKDEWGKMVNGVSALEC